MFGRWMGSWFDERHRMHARGPFAIITRAGVELNDEQVEKLAEIKGDGFLRKAEQRAAMLANVRKMIQLLTGSEIDKQQIRSLHKSIQESRNRVGEQMIEDFIEIAEVLSPAQRKQVRMHMLRVSLGLMPFDRDAGHDQDDDTDHEHGPRKPPRPPNRRR